MRLPALATVTTLAGAVVLAAWGALGIVGWRGPTVTIDAAVLDVGEPDNLLATSAVAAPAPTLITRRDIYDASLFSPQVTYAPQPTTQVAQPASEPAPPAGPELAAAESVPVSLTRRVVTASIEPEITSSLPVAAPPVREARVAPTPPPPPKLEQAFNVAQISRIKQSLNQTAEQEQFWEPVEAQLREIGRHLPPQPAGKKFKINISADAAQRLYWAAGPFLMSLREDQKQQVRRLAKSLGLDQVASLI
jgi:hypothetical protein